MDVENRWIPSSYPKIFWVYPKSKIQMRNRLYVLYATLMYSLSVARDYFVCHRRRRLRLPANLNPLQSQESPMYQRGRHPDDRRFTRGGGGRMPPGSWARGGGGRGRGRGRGGGRHHHENRQHPPVKQSIDQDQTVIEEIPSPNGNSSPAVRIAIEGCCHGELEAVYSRLQRHEADTQPIDLLLCCGDFETLRNLSDLHTIAVPPKYRSMGSFYKYYNGELVAPYLTIFVSGSFVERLTTETSTNHDISLILSSFSVLVHRRQP